MNAVIDSAGARKADLASIHIAKKDLGWDEDTYRDIMQAKCGVRSSGLLDFTGRKLFLAHLRACGWSGSKPAAKAANSRAGTGGPKRPRRPTPSEAVAPMCRKVRAQLISLGGLSDTYADGIAKQMFGVTFYEWCQPTQLHAVVAALAAEQVRKGVSWTPAKGRR